MRLQIIMNSLLLPTGSLEARMACGREVFLTDKNQSCSLFFYQSNWAKFRNILFQSEAEKYIHVFTDFSNKSSSVPFTEPMLNPELNLKTFPLTNLR